MGRRRLAKWFKAANQRRCDLISKKYDKGLLSEEQLEFEDLQKRCFEEVRRVHPLPTEFAMKQLKELERRIRIKEPCDESDGNPIHQENGQWYFWDETWSDRVGPYETEEKVREALKRYCKEYLGQ